MGGEHSLEGHGERRPNDYKALKLARSSHCWSSGWFDECDSILQRLADWIKRVERKKFSPWRTYKSKSVKYAKLKGRNQTDCLTDGSGQTRWCSFDLVKRLCPSFQYRRGSGCLVPGCRCQGWTENRCASGSLYLTPHPSLWLTWKLETRFRQNSSD